MMRSLLMISAAAMLFGANPVLAETPPAAPEATPDPVTCKYMAVTGSRVKREKVCMTASQWKEQRRTSRRFLEDVQRQAKNGTNGS